MTFRQLYREPQFTSRPSNTFLLTFPVILNPLHVGRKCRRGREDANGPWEQMYASRPETMDLCADVQQILELQDAVAVAGLLGQEEEAKYRSLTPPTCPSQSIPTRNTRLAFCYKPDFSLAASPHILPFLFTPTLHPVPVDVFCAVVPEQIDIYNVRSWHSAGFERAGEEADYMWRNDE